MFLITEENKGKFKNIRIVKNSNVNVNILIDSDRAINIAKDANLDLICTNDKKEPYICEIADFGKLKYEQTKFKKEQKKKQTVIVLKEIQIKSVTGENDILVKVKKINEFISEGNKVKIVLRLRGREQQSPEIGFKMVNNVIDKVVNYDYESPPKLQGRDIVTILKPLKKDN